MTPRDRQQQRAAMDHWRKTAAVDWATVHDLFRLKRYHWALFLCHLTLEKLLKATIIQTEQTPPYSHDLEHLMQLTRLKVPSHFPELLHEITTFHIEARYDTEKLAFYRKANREYTRTWLKHSEEIKQWLVEHLN